MIEVKNITKKYGKFYAVRNINFEVADGEIVGFLGKNGAGKSTTMNMITGYIEPTSGSILVNGYDIAIKPGKVKRQIGYMPEGTPLYTDLTVKEFVKYMAELRGIPRKERKEAVRKAIEVTGLEKVQNNLSKFLSRGYKQRVSLAGAIVGEPNILILDEPTVGLDPKQVVEIRELIKSLGKTHTIFISSHILSEIGQICDKVIIIDSGEIIAVDTPENLEKETRETYTYSITIDDVENKFPSFKEKISEIKEIILEKENDDGSKQYTVNTESKEDIRRNISSECSKLGIIVLEIKTLDTSLEDAFIKLVENRKEYSMKEMKKMQYEKELEELREEERISKENKELKKQAKKEAKARKEAEKAEKSSEENHEEKVDPVVEEVKEEKVESTAEEVKEEEKVESTVEEVKEEEKVESTTEEVKEEKVEPEAEEVKEEKVEPEAEEIEEEKTESSEEDKEVTDKKDDEDEEENKEEGGKE